MGLKPTIEELRKRFPIGTKVYPRHLFKKEGYFVVSTKEFMISDCYAWANTLDNIQNKGNDLENGTLRPDAHRVVWCNDSRGFAEIESKINNYELWEK